MSSFRVSADVLAGWKNALSDHRHVKGVDPVLKEMLEALQKEDAEQHVVLDRHKMFSWAEALRGASARAAGESQRALSSVADDVRSYLSPPAKDAPPRAAQAAAPSSSPALPPPVVAPLAPDAASSWRPAPAVVYAAPSAAPGSAMAPFASGATRLVSEREFPAEVARLLREARSEILLVSPWTAGLDTLSKELIGLPPGPQLRILSRRPPQDDAEYHRSLVELRRRNADLVLSPYIHTRMLVVDGQRAIVGAASLPGPQLGSREVAVLTMDPALVGAAREAFLRMIEEARGRS